MTTNIDLGGQSRPFCVGIGSLIEFEKRTGKNFLQMVQEPGANESETGLSISDLGILAYCCLLVGARAHKKNFDYEEYEIFDWIDEANAFGQINALITEGLGKLGTAEKKKPGRKAKA